MPIQKKKRRSLIMSIQKTTTDYYFFASPSFLPPSLIFLEGFTNIQNLIAPVRNPIHAQLKRPGSPAVTVN